MRHAFTRTKNIKGDKMAKRYKPLPTLYRSPATEKAVTKLSSKGMSKTAILRQMKLPANFFNHHKEPSLWFQNGRDQLSLKVSKDIIKATKTSFLDRRLLAEKLGCFFEPFETKEVKTPEDARDVLSQSLQRFTAGEISEGTLNTISKVVMSFIESYNQTVLQKDILELRKLLKEKR